MLKEKFINWLLQSLEESTQFNEFINTKILQFHQNSSLHHARVWGDKSKIKIGKNVQINDAMINTISGYVKLGDYSFLGHGVSLLTGTHNIEATNAQRQEDVPCKGRDIVIGNGVWIASGAIIYGPCNIGDNVVIGAGAVVTGNIKENTFYAGNPARKIREL